MTSKAPVPEVEVGPFWVNATSRAAIVGHVVDLWTTEADRAVLAYALHVGGLNARHDPDFVLAMRQADVVYADGGSVVWLARLAGAPDTERAPTTDVGWEIMQEFMVRTGRRPRVALMGGGAKLAERAGTVLADAGVADVVLTEHGYHDDWETPLSRLNEAAPDITLVGLGAPREMVWTHRHRDLLPPGLVLTCGGWFGHLTGDERRAPHALRRSGLEWIARLAQSPKRLGPRYARGLGATATLAVQTRHRRSTSDS